MKFSRFYLSKWTYARGTPVMDKFDFIEAPADTQFITQKNARDTIVYVYTSKRVTENDMDAILTAAVLMFPNSGAMEVLASTYLLVRELNFLYDWAARRGMNGGVRRSYKLR
jgi:hypothetical protein